MLISYATWGVRGHQDVLDALGDRSLNIHSTSCDSDAVRVQPVQSRTGQFPSQGFTRCTLEHYGGAVESPVHAAAAFVLIHCPLCVICQVPCDFRELFEQAQHGTFTVVDYNNMNGDIAYTPAYLACKNVLEEAANIQCGGEGEGEGDNSSDPDPDPEPDSEPEPDTNDESGDNNSDGPPTVLGCMDPTACNYNPDATEDPEVAYGVTSCDFGDPVIGCDEPVTGCMDSNACNYNPDANLSQDWTCDLVSGWNADGTGYNSR